MVLLVSEEVVAKPPSREDGLGAETEEQLRNYGGGLIQGAGLLLRLPQLTVASATALFQRFYFRRSFAEFEVRAAAGAAIALASKLEENHRTLKDVIIVVHRLHMRELESDDGEPAYASGPTPTLDTSSREYSEVKQEVLRAERFILRELGFDVATFLDPPHRYVLEYSSMLKLPHSVLQKAWNYVNDSMRTKLCCTHQPDQIALASVLLAARSLGVKLPDRPPWWEAFDAKAQPLKDIAEAILALYTKPLGEHIEVPKRRKVAAAASSEHLAASAEAAPAKSPSDEEAAEPPAPEANGAAARQDGGAPEAAPPQSAAVTQPPARAAPGFDPEPGRDEERRRAPHRNGGAKDKERHRDRRKEKDREADRDRERDRDRDREKEREREKEKEKERERDRKREKERKERERRKSRCSISSGSGRSSSRAARSDRSRSKSRSRSRSKSRSAGRRTSKATKQRSRQTRDRRPQRSESGSAGSASSTRSRKAAKRRPSRLVLS